MHKPRHTSSRKRRIIVEFHTFFRQHLAAKKMPQEIVSKYCCHPCRLLLAPLRFPAKCAISNNENKRNRYYYPFQILHSGGGYDKNSHKKGIFFFYLHANNSISHLVFCIAHFLSILICCTAEFLSFR